MGTGTPVRPGPQIDTLQSVRNIFTDGKTNFSGIKRQGAGSGEIFTLFYMYGRHVKKIPNPGWSGSRNMPKFPHVNRNVTDIGFVAVCLKFSL